MDVGLTVPGAVLGIARFWLTGTALILADFAGIALDAAKHLRANPSPTTRTVMHEGDWTDGNP